MKKVWFSVEYVKYFKRWGVFRHNEKGSFKCDGLFLTEDTANAKAKSLAEEENAALNSAVAVLPSVVHIWADGANALIYPIDEVRFGIDSNEQNMPDNLTAVELITFCLLCVEDWDGETPHFDFDSVRKEAKEWIKDWFAEF